jgi:hypothetical protein
MTADALFVFDAEPIGAGRAGLGQQFSDWRCHCRRSSCSRRRSGCNDELSHAGTCASYVAVGITAAAGALAVTVKRRQLNSGRTGSARMTLSAEGITLTSAVQTTTIQWAAVRIEEGRNDFVFYLPEAQPVRVRKAAISQAQGVERLRSFLMGQVGTRAKLLA